MILYELHGNHIAKCKRNIRLLSMINKIPMSNVEYKYYGIPAIIQDDKAYLQFESEKHMTMFLLRMEW